WFLLIFHFFIINYMICFLSLDFKFSLFFFSFPLLFFFTFLKQSTNISLDELIPSSLSSPFISLIAFFIALLNSLSLVPSIIFGFFAKYLHTVFFSVLESTQ